MFRGFFRGASVATLALLMTAACTSGRNSDETLATTTTPSQTVVRHCPSATTQDTFGSQDVPNSLHPQFTGWKPYSYFNVKEGSCQFRAWLLYEQPGSDKAMQIKIIPAIKDESFVGQIDVKVMFDQMEPLPSLNGDYYPYQLTRENPAVVITMKAFPEEESGGKSMLFVQWTYPGQNHWAHFGTVNFEPGCLTGTSKCQPEIANVS